MLTARETARVYEQRFRDVMDSSFDRFWETDENHRFSFFSDTSDMNDKFPQKILIGQTRWEAAGLSEDHDENWRHHVEDLNAHRPFRGFLFHSTEESGVECFFSINGVPFFDEAGVFKVFRGSATDITEKELADRAVETANNRLASALNGIPQVFALWDAEDRLVICNEQFRRSNPEVNDYIKVGVRYEDFLQALIDAGLFPAAVGREADFKEERLRIHQTPGTSIEIERRDGRWLLLSEQKTDNGEILTISTDITERKKMEETLRVAHDELDARVIQRTAALQENQELLQAVIDAAPLIINVTDKDFRFRLINEYEAAQYGIRPEDAIGKTLFDITDSKLAERVAAANREVFDSGETSPGLEIVEEYANHHRIWLSTKAPIRGPGGEVTGVVSIALDITEQRHREEQLRQAQKMEVVGQLTGGVAHDFNNLLTIVMGYLELINEAYSETEGLAALVKAAIDATNRGGALTHRLLAFSRRQTLRPTSVDINELTADTLLLLQRTIGESVEIETVLDPSAERVFVDASQLENALLNLAVNARDAMSSVGKITVETSNVILDQRYAATNDEVAPGPYVSLCVTDNGAGMAPEVTERIFEPFFTTKEVGQGSGLGLSMVYGFAKQSGGHITVHSELGKGATFKLYLPQIKSAAAETEEATPMVSTGAKGETILLIEDDPDLRALTQKLLERLGYVVWVAGEAAEAEQLLLGRGLPDLILSDIVLPNGVSGIEFAEKVSRKWPSIKLFSCPDIRKKRFWKMGDCLMTPC